MLVAFCLFKYFPYGGLQRDFMRIAQEVENRGHQVRIYVADWQGEKPDTFDIVHVPISAQDGPDGVAQLSGGIEIRGHETGRRVDTGKALTLALRKNTGGNNRTHHRKKDSSLHCRII